MDIQNVGNVALSGMAGAAQGAVQGAATGMNIATGIQNIQNSQQEMAIRGEAMKKYQEEERQRTMPVYEEEAFKNVPPMFRESYENRIKPLMEQGVDGKKFIQKGKLQEVHKELNTGILGRYQMSQEGISWLNKQIQPIDEKLQGLKSQWMPIEKQVMKEIEDAKEAGDFKKAKKLQDKMQFDISDPKGAYYKQYQEALGLVKQRKNFQEQKALLQQKTNAANDHIEKLMEKTGLSGDTIIMALEGYKEALDQFSSALNYKENLKAITEQKKIASREKIAEKKIMSAKEKASTKVKSNLKKGDKVFNVYENGRITYKDKDGDEVIATAEDLAGATRIETPKAGKGGGAPKVLGGSGGTKSNLTPQQEKDIFG